MTTNKNVIPEFNKDGLALSIAVTEALLEFVSKDEVRAGLYGIGIDDSMVCATDEHTAVRFRNCSPIGVQPADWNHRVFSLGTVKTALAVAKSRKAPVLLNWTDLQPADIQFPPLAQVVPQHKMSASAPVGVNAKYLARLAKVAKACDVQGCTLIGLNGEYDPILFSVDGKELQADVVIMPMRI